jgi:GNAT superfamily N-acetyltransferase
MTEIFQRIKKLYSQFGLTKFITTILSALISKVFAINVDIVSFVSLADLRDYSGPQRLKISPLKEDSMRMFKEFCQNTDCTLKNRKVLNSYLQNKFNGFIATLDKRIIGYFWWVDNQIPPTRNHPHLIRYGIKLMDSEVYTFDFFIRPKYRGGGNAVEFLTTVQFKLKELGFEKVYGQVFADNKAARWLYSLIGNKPIKTVRSYRILKLILISNNRIFIRNNKMYSSYSFDYRPLFPHPS